MKIYMDAYLAKNLGDDLFVKILTQRYQNHDFFAISKGVDNDSNLPNLKIFSNSYIFRMLKKFQWEKHLANHYDLVVSIGGSMYMENNDADRDFSLGKNKRYILGTNFGPYKTQEYYDNLYNMFKNVEDICFREKYSYDLFKQLPNVRYASDIVFSMDISNIKITNRKRAIISVISCDYKLDKKYTEEYEQVIIKLIQFFLDKKYEVCLMSFCRMEKDEEAIESILEKCDEDIKEKVETYYYDGNIEEALNVLGDSQVIVGSRFHANVIGLLLDKAIIPILYSDKTKHVLDDMNIQTKVIDIRNLSSVDVNKITDEDLNKHFNVEDQKEDAQKHFEKLDNELLESNKKQ